MFPLAKNLKKPTREYTLTHHDLSHVIGVLREYRDAHPDDKEIIAPIEFLTAWWYTDEIDGNNAPQKPQLFYDYERYYK